MGVVMRQAGIDECLGVIHTNTHNDTPIHMYLHA